MKEYKKVPNIITGKDLDYLKDIFNWHYIIYKYEENAINNINDKEIVKNIKECNNIFYKNMQEIINILESSDQYE